MPTPFGKSLAELAEELRAADSAKEQSALLKAICLELARLIESQDIPSRSRGLSWDGSPQPGDIDAPAPATNS